MNYQKKRKNIIKRKGYKITELFQRLLKIFYYSFKNNILKLLLKEHINKFFNYNHFFTYLKNFCIITGRSRGIYSKFRVSRIFLRNLSTKGSFFGLKKAS
jgi:ribosomal protein S14